MLSRFGMAQPKPDRGEYRLSAPYTIDEELDRIIYDGIRSEVERIEDGRHCFTAGEITSLEDPDRRW